MSLTPIDEMRLASIGRRVRTFRSTPIDARLQASSFIFGCLSDQAFLLDLYLKTKRSLDHLANSATATAPAMPKADPTPVTTPRRPLPALLADVDATWRSAIAAAAAEATRVWTQAMRDGASPYAARDRAVEAILALKPGLPPAPLLHPPTEPPPFTT